MAGDYSIRIMTTGLSVPVGQEKVVLYNTVDGSRFVTTADRKDYYLSKPAPRQILPDGSVRKVQGVDKLFSEYPPRSEDLAGRPTGDNLKTSVSTKKRKRGSRGRK
jgi:hypothetical protein